MNREPLASYAGCDSPAQIQACLHCREPDCVGIGCTVLKRLRLEEGLRRRARTRENDMDISRLYDTGMKIPAIAKALNIPVKSVRAWKARKDYWKEKEANMRKADIDGGP